MKFLVRKRNMKVSFPDSLIDGIGVEGGPLKMHMNRCHSLVDLMILFHNLSTFLDSNAEVSMLPVSHQQFLIDRIDTTYRYQQHIISISISKC